MEGGRVGDLLLSRRDGCAPAGFTLLGMTLTSNKQVAVACDGGCGAVQCRASGPTMLCPRRGTECQQQSKETPSVTALSRNPSFFRHKRAREIQVRGCTAPAGTR